MPISMVASTADELNARNQRFLDDAAKLLGESDYLAIFGVPRGTKVNLVLSDPTKANPRVAMNARCFGEF